MISTQIFMKIQGQGSLTTVKGGCTVPAFKDWIYISYFKWGMNRKSANNATIEKEKSKTVTFESLSITKVFDSASAQLLKMLKAEERIRMLSIVVVDFTLGGSKTEKILEVKFQDGHVQSVEIDLKDDDDLSEDVDFSFNTMTFQYFPAATAAGGGRATSPMSYDIVPMGESSEN